MPGRPERGPRCPIVSAGPDRGRLGGLAQRLRHRLRRDARISCETCGLTKHRQLSPICRSIFASLTTAPPAIDFAVVITDLLRLKPRVVPESEVTWRHLAASCAVPLVLPQMRIDGRLYSDGGLLNPVPV